MVESEGAVDVVLWGATGFVGRRIAEYLAERRAIDEVSWGIAGRDEEKLRALREDLAERDDRLSELPILTGDALERPTLERLARRADVVCTTVGPYDRYGTPLVEACVEYGTDYCDLTGEVHWMREIVDGYHDAAREAGARIVHACGFDSIPSDLGTYLLQKRAVERFGRPCTIVKSFVRRMRGGLSGGTFASMMDTVGAAARDDDVRRILVDPYSLNPPGEREGPDEGTQTSPRWDEDASSWTAPFVMAATNERIVRRTNALLEYRYGRDFRFSESMTTDGGIRGALTAAGVSAGLGAFTGALAFRPSRAALETFVLPDPGEGPSPEEIERGSFEMELIGKLDPGGKPSLRVRVGADSDPGYGATATMCGEAALALAEDDPPEGLDGGVLTPAAALGMPFVERLREGGMTVTAQ